jgi:Phage portal protein, lambda family
MVRQEVKQPWWERWFGVGKAIRPARKFSGLYDGGLITRARPFLGYWNNDPHHQISNYDLARLRSNSRKLFANLGAIRSPILQRTEYGFGSDSWQPRFIGSDKDFGDKATKLLINEILPQIDVRGQMFPFRKGLAMCNTDVDKDGDVLLLFTEDDDGMPRIQYIPANRIGQRQTDEHIQEGEYAGCEIHLGVITSDDTPVAYMIAGHTPEEDMIVSVDDAMLIYDAEVNGFPRGIPLPSFALNALEDMLVTQSYEQQALMLAGHLALIETNPEGSSPDFEAMINNANWEATWENPDGHHHPVLPPIDTQETLGGAVRYLRSNTGSKLEAFKSERPSAEWDAFMERLTRQYCNGIPWPYELAWSPEKIGGASVRLVTGQAQRSVGTRQSLMFPVAKRIVTYAVAKLIELGELPESDDWAAWTFTLPPRISVDAGRDERARIDSYKAGLLNETEWLAEEGKDLDHHLDERINEVVKRELKARAAEEKFGIKIDRNLLISLFPNPTVPDDSGAAKETPVTTPSGEAPESGAPSQDTGTGN